MTTLKLAPTTANTAPSAMHAMKRKALVSCTENKQWIEPFFGERICIRVRSTEVEGAYTILEGTMAPQVGPPLHVHLNEDEIFEVLEGSLRFFCEGEVFDVSAGNSVVIPRGTAHAWKNFTDQPARVLVIFTPGGIEPFFEEIVGKEPADIEGIAYRYGTTIVGPPL